LRNLSAGDGCEVEEADLIGAEEGSCGNGYFVLSATGREDVELAGALVGGMVRLAGTGVSGSIASE